MRDYSSEFAAHSDRKVVEAYQATRGFKPGIDSWNMEWQERQDRALVEYAVLMEGGKGAVERHDFSTPAGRLAAWETVDYLKANPDEARQMRVADALAELGVTEITPGGAWSWTFAPSLDPYPYKG